MKSLLLRRRLVTAEVGKPYDSQIEYIATTSDGGQWIDTGIVPDNSVFKAETEMRIGITGQDSGVLELYTSATRYYLIDLGTNYVRAMNFGGTWNSTKVVDIINGNNSLFHKIVSVIGNGNITFTFDSTTKTKNTAEGITTSDTLALFNRKVGANPGTAYAKSIYLKYLKIYKDNVLVRDYIPVRKGQVGYLFDKVSEQLFGNLGTGAFILGADVIS